MINVALFSLLAGIGGSIVFSIDKIVINRFLGLSETGIYAIGFYFATLVIIPSRPLLKISGTLIADAWKRNDVEYISDIYTRSCINQFIIGSFLFGGLWLNINNIIDILGPEYSAIKWVVFYVGLGYLFDMLTGANDQVIGYSRYYKISLLFLLILVVVVLISMYFLIPLMGVAGAALSIALAFLIYNLLRSAFLYFKFGIQPFPVTLIWILLIFGISIVPGLIIPRLNLYIDVFMRSLVFSVIFVSLVIVLKISPDINNLLKAYLKFKRRS
jgi:O-antigen/teichoic acid export membrane protein